MNDYIPGLTISTGSVQHNMSGSPSEHRPELEKEPILQCPYTDEPTLESLWNLFYTVCLLLVGL